MKLINASKFFSIIASYVLRDLPLHCVSLVHMNYFECTQYLGTTDMLFRLKKKKLPEAYEATC